jgi:hypothetical protein
MRVSLGLITSDWNGCVPVAQLVQIVVASPPVSPNVCSRLRVGQDDRFQRFLFAVRDNLKGCDLAMMFLLRLYRQTVLIDLFPELLPAPLAEHQGTKAQNNARPAFEPTHARATKPLFDKGLARRLGDPGTDG